MKKLHLICNAHIDPIWLWDWEEGASAAVSTFRSAAKLAGEFDFIFNHNEVTLYRWIEEYEPELFESIRSLAAQGKWHIMGGWYLQPDCNMPQGESLVRQALRGREYFQEHFHQTPATAVNVDPFGHSVGLVQILAKCGFDSYLFCRPYPAELELADDRFLWVGLDGSQIKCFRASSGYLTLLGETADKVRAYIRENSDVEIGMFLWGVGNHGGGPSRKDLEDLQKLTEESGVEIVHSTPEAYFAEFKDYRHRVDRSLYPSMVGCYTSMSAVKQRHRQLENLLYSTEKLCVLASASGAAYPEEALEEAERDLLSAQFHDVLPGTAIRSGGEIAGVRMLDHGLEILSRARAKAFFHLVNAFPAEQGETYPVFVFNPHPYPLKCTVDCEFMLANQNWGEDFTFFRATQNGATLPSQIVQEASNLNLDWRKRILFDCELPAFAVERFECVPYRVPAKPVFAALEGDFTFENPYYCATINRKTGLIDRLSANGAEYLRPDAFRLTLVDDTDDPWGMSQRQLRRLGEAVDSFDLMDDVSGSRFSGLKDRVIPSLRVVEDGEVVTVVEAVFACRNSQAHVKYFFYKNFPEIDLEYAVFWNEKSMALKLSVPAALQGEYLGEVPFGRESLPSDGREVPAQKWTAVAGEERALALINDGIYGSSCEGNTLLPTLLRSPAYSAHPLEGRPLLRTDRFTERMDQGEHRFRFRLAFGKSSELLPLLSTKAAVFNERPYALNAYPSGKGKQVKNFLAFSNPAVTLAACKLSPRGGVILRAFHNSLQSCRCTVSVEGGAARLDLKFSAFEAKTLRYQNGKLTECERMEL